MGDDPLPFLDGRLAEPFRRRVFVVAPGCRRAYEPADWEDALVVVQSGAIELETRGGERRCFHRGDVLCLGGLSLAALWNPGAVDTLLVAVSRRLR